MYCGKALENSQMASDINYIYNRCVKHEMQKKWESEFISKRHNL